MWNYYNPVDVVFGENKFSEIHKILENKKYVVVTHPEEIFKKYTDQLNTSSNPERPISSETRAFCKDSLKFLPIAIASPTDLIDVPRVASVSANFSNVNLGIFVTT